MKYYYTIYGLNLVSDYELPDAYKNDNTDQIDIYIKSENIDEQLIMETEDEIQQGTGWRYLIGKKWACIRFVNNGTFIISNGNTIAYHLKEGCDHVYIQDILLCLCLSMLMMQRGDILFHGSCVFHNNKSFLICGESGAGKSTLTSELIDRGAQYLTDDISPIIFEADQILASSGYPKRKLCKDTAETYMIKVDQYTRVPHEDREKYNIYQLDRFHLESSKLNAIVIISVDDINEVCINEIVGSEKIKYIFSNMFREEEYMKIGFGKEQHKKCMQIAQHIPMYLLRRPRNGMTVKQQWMLIDEMVRTI